jgi:uncharacterized protein
MGILFRNKEKRELKKWHLIVVLFFIVAAVLYNLYNRVLPKSMVTIHNQDFSVLVADNNQRRFKGLSGRKDLGRHSGMLFIFDSPGIYAMVMRDMRFPLDFIWINDNRVVDMAPNVPLEPGVSGADLQLYFPRQPSTYVLEAAAGFITKNKIKIGDKIKVGGL